MALEMATLGGAACLGRTGELGQIAVGAVADIAVWPLGGPAYAGAFADPIEAWLRCGPTAARHTVINGRVIVEDGQLCNAALDPMLRRHRQIAERIQGPLS
jgi:cytosine/adenosine deaminase-related metal-dependent hydrolase